MGMCPPLPPPFLPPANPSFCKSFLPNMSSPLPPFDTSSAKDLAFALISEMKNLMMPLRANCGSIKCTECASSFIVWHDGDYVDSLQPFCSPVCHAKHVPCDSVASSASTETYDDCDEYDEYDEITDELIDRALEEDYDW